MEYKYRNIKTQRNIFKDKEGNTWEYISWNDIQDQPLILGEVTGEKAGTANSWITQIEDEVEKKMRVHPYREKLSFFEKIHGYIAVVDEEEKEGYLRIRKKSLVKIMMPILLTLFIIIGGCLWFYMKNNEPLLDKTAIAYQMPNGVKNTDAESILLPGYDILYLNKKSKQVDVALFNPDGNQCYFRFHIVLKESQKEVFQTGLIKPGTAVTKFKIEEDLKEGEYPIIIKVDTVDLKNTDKSLNGGAIEAKLKVE